MMNVSYVVRGQVVGECFVVGWTFVMGCFIAGTFCEGKIHKGAFYGAMFQEGTYSILKKIFIKGQFLTGVSL